MGRIHPSPALAGVGAYDCYVDESLFKIGFYGHDTCAAETKLADGPEWRPIPGTCL